MPTAALKLTASVIGREARQGDERRNGYGTGGRAGDERGLGRPTATAQIATR